MGGSGSPWFFISRRQAMRMFWTAALILTLTGLLEMATAQETKKQAPKKMSAQVDILEIMLLRQKSVRNELKLDDEEAKKIYEFTHKQYETAQEVHKLPEADQKER